MSALPLDGPTLDRILSGDELSDSYTRELLRQARMAIDLEAKVKETLGTLNEQANILMAIVLQAGGTVKIDNRFRKLVTPRTRIYISDEKNNAACRDQQVTFVKVTQP